MARHLLATIGALVVAFALAPAASAMPNEIADESWGTNGRVSAIVQIGDIVYVGGSFTQVIENGGDGPGVLNRSNLAAFDARTGAPTSWAPQANSEVLALDVSPDKTRIYVGGKFTKINDVGRYRLAAVKPDATGTLESWKTPSISSTVLSVDATSSRVYVGGFFTSIGGVTRNRLAAFSPTTGELDTLWAPSADGGVLSVVVSPSGDRVFVGGSFTVVSGQTRQMAAALGASGGEVLSWRPDPGHKVFGFVVRDDNVYTAVGGSSNSVINYDYSSASRKWQRRTDGDVQALALSGRVLYVGGHWERFEGEVRRKLVAVDAATGTLRRDWAPKLPTSATTWYGIAALSASGESRIAAGGDFTSVSGHTQQHYAQWTGTVGGMAGDTSPPSQPTQLRASAFGGSRIDLDWTASSDNDAVANYGIYRNGSRIATAETAKFSDTTVSPNRTYSYHVVASDFAGNSSAASNTAGATTPAANESRTFTATEDSYVTSATPTANFGSSSTLKVGLEPPTDMLLKFNLSGLSGRRVVSAKLRLYNTEESVNGGDFSRLPDNSWSESSVTWENAPAADEAVAHSLDDVDPGKWAEADVTPFVKGDGALSVRVKSKSTNGASYQSSEGSNKPQLVVTLAAAGATLPQGKLFEDGFESGDLSRWTDYLSLTAQTAQVASGSWAARGTSTGQATWAYKDLPLSEPDVTYRTRFRVGSQTEGSVTLLRLLTGAGSPLVRLYLSSSTRLAVTNEVTALGSTHPTVVSKGDWHSLELHAVVSDTAPKIEVKLDGAPVTTLSRSDSLGTTPIGRIQLGEKLGNKAYDVYFDDVALENLTAPDTTPPSAPANVRATAEATGSRVDVAWDASSDDTGVTGYEVFRNGTQVASLDSTANSYSDASVAHSTTYQYTVRARDAAGNPSPFSTPASVTTPGPDTTPPTQPTGLVATPISFDRVNLSWTASTDARGVTDYRIFRDGQQIGATNGPATVYSDTTAAASSSYVYTVQAVDEAGNVSPVSAGAAATTPAPALFQDGFESGDFSQWTSKSGSFSVTQGAALTGAFGARASSTGSGTYLRKVLGSPSAELVYETRFKPVSQGKFSVELLSVRTADDSSIAKFYLSSSGKLAMYNYVAKLTSTSTSAPAKGWWHTLRVYSKVAGSASRTLVTLDGTPVAALTRSESLGSQPIGSLDLGDNDSGETYEVHYDDVWVAAPPSNTQAPVISGNARDGDTLTAQPGTWSGTSPIGFAYRWQRCDAAGANCTDIAGANQSSYALTASDVGARIRVAVDASNAAGSASATSVATSAVAPVPPVNTQPPTVSGTARDGETLTAATGTWTGTPPLGYSYQWQRCDQGGGACTDIAGATQGSYRLTAAEVDRTVRVRVTATNSAGSAAAVSQATALVAPAPPANLQPPTVSGTARHGETLTASPGTWSGTPPIAYAYQWQRCDLFGPCVDISGATSDRYTLTVADVGATVRVRVVASNVAGSSSAFSASSQVVLAAPPANTQQPTVSGTARDGETLTAAPGTWTGTPPIGYSYRWQRCDVSGAGCVDIAGADQSAYVLTPSDVGKRIRVAVEATNSAGSAGATSSATPAVAPAPPANTQLPTVSGTARDGEILTADPGTWSGTPPIAYAYQWQRCDQGGGACTDIAGATQSSYELRPPDVDRTIRVKVTATNAAGSVDAASATTPKVAPAPPVNVQLPSVSGTARHGETLTADRGVWSGTPPIAYAYQWQRCQLFGPCQDISGATGDRYTLTVADVGATVRVRVVGSNVAGSSSAFSATSQVVLAAPPANTQQPTVSGTARDGETLTADRGTWSGTPTIGYSYQWRRCDAAGANCADIAGADDAAYTLIPADVDGRIRVMVTATNAAGSVSASSAATGAVAPAPPANTQQPTVSGTARDGEILTADQGSWSGTPPIDYAYQWQRCDVSGEGCADIAGADRSDYELASADVSSRIRVVVSASNRAGAASSASAPTQAVTTAPPTNVAAPTISGAPQDGHELTADPGTWKGTEPLAFAYQWQRCDLAGICGDIPGADSRGYVLTAADVGSTVRVKVMASNPEGVTTAVSSRTLTVAAVAPANTQLPTISGTPRDAETLTVDRGSWDGTGPLSFGYQWRRCDAAGAGCADIAGADQESYELTAADIGSTVRVVVTAANGAGTDSATSAPTAQVEPAPPANVAAPSISGTPRDRETLTADRGTWTGTEPIGYAYQWRRCDAGGANCTDIAGANQSTYPLTASDVGRAIRVLVAATNAGGSGNATSQATTAVEPAPPANVQAPTISGTARDGETLTADRGVWTGTPPLAYAYQWRRCDAGGAGCADISGADQGTYKLTPADVGHKIRVLVRATNSGGSQSATSEASALVEAAPPANTQAPTISGTARDGQTLTANRGTWTGTPPIDFAYQWRRCDAGGANCADIGGADQGTYSLTAADVGQTIRLAVTATNAAGSAGASSAASEAVAPAPPANTQAPTISGTARDGQTLTADRGTWTGTPPIDFAYQWRRCDAGGANCTDIAGADQSTYSLVAADVGQKIRVLVRATNAGGSQSTSSQASALVEPAPPANIQSPTISGIARDGETLTADRGVWTGTPPLAYAYKWQRCAADGTGCADITGADQGTYKLTPSDVGYQVQVVVTATNAGGSQTASSAATASVEAAPPANTQTPSISGTARDGQTLSADRGSWTGTQPLVFAYKWRRCDADGANCADIAGADQSTYTLAGADVGRAVRVVVTATNTGGSDSSSSAATASVEAAPPVNNQTPSISGTARDGQTLTADRGTWTGTQPIAYTYQWRRCDAGGANCTDIAGADEGSYTLTPGDIGRTVRISVTATNGGGSAGATSQATASVEAAPPANTDAPTIAGLARDGETLTADRGTWTGTAPIAYSYQWRRCDAGGASCADIGGADNSTYTVTAGDTGSTIRVIVTATNAAGSRTATSQASAVVGAAPPANTQAPVISGTPRDGQTLTAARGSWTGTDPIAYSYQWRRCDADGANCADISGADQSEYTLRAGDVGRAIRVVVTATNAAGTQSASSQATSSVEAAPPANTQQPTISGTARDGEMLSAQLGTWAGTEPIAYSYQWRRCDAGGANCVDIAGADQGEYTLRAGDVGRAIRVVVSATNAAGTQSASSQATSSVEAAPPANTQAPSISGTTRDGQTLTATRGTWAGTEPIAYSYQWRRCDADGANCADIAGADQSEYTLRAGDIGNRIRVLVSATNAGGSGSASSDASAPVEPAGPANTEQPTISGTARDGELLSAQRGTWTGTEPIAYAYRWQRCDITGAQCTDIGGADQSTYRLAPADVGNTIRVVVTATNAAGPSSAASAVTAGVQAAPPANTQQPTISGTTRDGQTLTADRGTWTGTAPIAYAYQWRRCDAGGAGCSDIGGADQSTYTLAPGDVGSTIRVAVTATNAGGAQTAVSAASASVGGAPPANTEAPSISGTTRDGETLTADRGTWTGTAPIAYAYQWRRCDAGGTGCSDISGADQSTYTLAAGDVGRTIRVAVTATNAGGSQSATSQATAGVQAAAPANTQAPSISGTTRDGEILTADRGTWTGTAPIAYSYQWQLCDTDGANCVDIAGADQGTYRLGPNDVDGTLRVSVVGTNAAASVTARSAATPKVEPAPPANTATPTISGTARDGATLTADRGTWTGTAPIAYAYQWRRCDAGGAGCSDIGGADQSTYTLAPGDVGRTIRVAVTATNAGGSNSAGSDATAAVQAAPPANTQAPTISGTARDGETLTAARGSWTGTEPISYAFRWQRCDAAGANCSNIAGADQQAYTLTASDVGSTMRAQVTATNGAGSHSASSAASEEIAPAPPSNTQAPSISGAARKGEALTADRGSWSGTEPISYAYQWLRCDQAGANCADIGGADQSGYTLTAADVDSRIRVRVTATNAAGSGTATSPATAAVTAPPANTQAPSISGTARDGETLTADRGTWAGTAPITYAYQWRRCDSTGAGCADIGGADQGTYTLTSADVGHAIRVAVTATNAVGADSATSEPTTAAEPLPPANTQAPSISGTTRDGETLTADRGSWSGTVPITYSFQWQRCDPEGVSCTDIAGADQATYELRTADVDSTMRIEVTAANSGGSVTARSAATVRVEAAPPANTEQPTISGTARDGEILTAGRGLWTGTDPIAHAFGWQRCDVDGANCTDIAGADQETYALTGADVGSTIRVAVTGTNSAGNATARSEPTEVVLAF